MTEIKELFDLEKTIAAPLFAGKTYPWEVLDGIKEATYNVAGTEVKLAVASGLSNARALLDKVNAGEADYHFIEIMGCPGGCVNGGGQPFAPYTDKEKRGAGLYAADRLCSIKSSEENPLMATLYDGLLKGRSHELLHVHYYRKEK